MTFVKSSKLDNGLDHTSIVSLAPDLLCVTFNGLSKSHSEKRVLMVPERGFNCEKPDHFRIVYLPRPSVLKEAMGGLREFLETYHH